MKYQWRKNEKQFYLPKTKVETLAMPEQRFIAVYIKQKPWIAPELLSNILLTAI